MSRDELRNGGNINWKFFFGFFPEYQFLFLILILRYMTSIEFVASLIAGMIIIIVEVWSLF